MIIDLINNESFGYMIEVPGVHFCMNVIQDSKKNFYRQELNRYYRQALVLRNTYYTTHQFLANTLETRPVALSDFAKQDLLKIKNCLRTIIRKHGLLITSITGIKEFKDENELRIFLQRIIMEDYYFLRVYFTSD